VDSQSHSLPRQASGFRRRLFFATTLLVGGLSALGAVFAHRHLPSAAERELELAVDRQILAAANARSMRQAILTRICHSLARQPRIHAALEDDALDLLYPSAHHELRQLTEEWSAVHLPEDEPGLQAKFYRFLDRGGGIIAPMTTRAVGVIDDELSRRISLHELPEHPVFGYFPWRSGEEFQDMVEVIAVPIVSHETFEGIAALVVGFPYQPWVGEVPDEASPRMGVWAGEGLFIPGFDDEVVEELRKKVLSLIREPARSAAVVPVEGIPHRVVVRPLNPNSLYPGAYEVAVVSMAEIQAMQKRLRDRILMAGGVLMLVGLAVGHWVSSRFSKPVEALAVATEEEHSYRIRAEEALDRTSEELRRAARFSADASHQLKTPVAVMRAGLEELLLDSSFNANTRGELQALLQHTDRLTNVIEDLLLLSRLDTGRLQLALGAEPIRPVVEGLLDDFSTLPDEFSLTYDVEIAPELVVLADRRHLSMILQVLLENARKYNRANGTIQVKAALGGALVHCRIGNTGDPIPPETQPCIFERFHRGASGEDIPGYGLGLNLARKLALLHNGDLSLRESANDWTEFVLRLPVPH